MNRFTWGQCVVRWAALGAISKKAMWSLIAAWVGLVSWGISTMMAFEQTPGLSGELIFRWPEVSRLRLSSLRPTLIMFIHSQCSCSRASLDELKQIMAVNRGRLEAHVLFYRPAGRKWAAGDLWQRASAMAGVQVSWDEGGVEASRFGALTSGDTLLWSPTGELLFRGGVTAARGQAGDNPGRRAVVSLLLTGSAAQSRTPVFGCAVKVRGTASIPVLR